ncbi:MAG TPA: hypothetical protein VHU42_06180, partial [Rhodopila sp.]|nr:hypothetical protein [Rhodopila sp.]
LRSGGGQDDNAQGGGTQADGTQDGGTQDGGSQQDAVITPAQHAAIDAARQDMLETRQKLRAVQLALNRDISTLADEMRVFTIVLVPALLTILAISMGVVQRRRRARVRR